ncbi:MAG: hypothetical protein M5U28_04145 [Sandaracinaceae bacterium]|nr:hypothetical protein [Sandaracinaceae bacterium]
MRRAALALALFALACGQEPPPAPEPSPSERAVREVKRYVDTHVAALADAVRALCAAAPAPDPDGWSHERDRAAVDAMRAEWRRARVEYERIEGAIAILFPHIDQAIDGRYEHEAELRRDDEPFDDRGFVGMHAVERILWSGSIPAPADRFERALPGYVEPRFPTSAEEARAFREGLCARLMRDVETMREQLAPLALDAATAWRGIQGSVEEQSEKVLLGATGQDESRYAESTLADMRANLEGRPRGARGLRRHDRGDARGARAARRDRSAHARARGGLRWHRRGRAPRCPTASIPTRPARRTSRRPTAGSSRCSRRRAIRRPRARSRTPCAAPATPWGSLRSAADSP